MKKIAIVFICLLITGCVSMLASALQKPHIEVFNDNDFLPYIGKGTGKIYGQAFLKTRGGEIRYGAGNQVVLIPMTPYVKEFYEREFINGEILSPSDNRLLQYRRIVTADGQGNFEFKEIPPGEYCLLCNIYWEIPGRFPTTTGGIAHNRVTIREGEEIKVVVTY